MNQWKQKRQTMQHYDQSATTYDTQYHDEQQAKIKTALTNLKLKKQNLILDAGCGTGLLFPHIADKAKLIIGIDTSKNILKQAKKRKNKHSNIALIRADADYTPIKNNTFHTAFAITLLQNTPKPQKTLKEIKRTTKQDATIIATALKKTFTQKQFTQLLKQTKLKTKTLTQDKNQKEYIATCTKTKETLKRTQTPLI